MKLVATYILKYSMRAESHFEEHNIGTSLCLDSLGSCYINGCSEEQSCNF
jgi:hypothetical protein